jgi:hypothetical protein
LYVAAQRHCLYDDEAVRSGGNCDMRFIHCYSPAGIHYEPRRASMSLGSRSFGWTPGLESEEGGGPGAPAHFGDRPDLPALKPAQRQASRACCR